MLSCSSISLCFFLYSLLSLRVSKFTFLHNVAAAAGIRDRCTSLTYFSTWSSGSHRWNRYLLLAQAYLLCNDSRVVLKSPTCRRGWDLQSHIHSFGSSTHSLTAPCLAKSNSTLATTTKHPSRHLFFQHLLRSTTSQHHHNAFSLKPQHCFRLSSPSQDCLLDFSHSHPQCSSVTCLRELRQLLDCQQIINWQPLQPACLISLIILNWQLQHSPQPQSTRA